MEVRNDRLARSLSHLLEVIERLDARGALFRQIEDLIDMASSQDKFTLQFLGAAAEFEWALIRGRTKAGSTSARLEGRICGNPGLRDRNPDALRKMSLARHNGFLERVGQTAAGRVTQVRRLHCDMVWEDVPGIVNAPCHTRATGGKVGFRGRWTPMCRTACSPRLWAAQCAATRRTVCPATRFAHPDATLQAICNQLEAMRERTHEVGHAGSPHRIMSGAGEHWPM